MPNPIDFFDTEPGLAGVAAGPRVNGPLWLTDPAGVVMKDTGNGKLYQLTMLNGDLVIQEIEKS